ncbi:MAG: hypothetical protein H7293_07220 [Candidatus Saccharibacteria bacterium]|nr:hypothetical protein [Rhodoferax sp.]
MSSLLVPDIITIVGTSYFQPIADLIERMLKRPVGADNAMLSGHFENGYAAATAVLLVATLESFVSRVRFLRNAEVVIGKDVPDQLQIFFPDLPNHGELAEVFLLRNIVVHNHVWHLDVSDMEERGVATIANPKDLKFQTKRTYDDIVDIGTRKTVLLGLSASPTSVDRYDVGAVFRVIWATLKFMNEKNFSHTPLAGQTVCFDGKLQQFEELLERLPKRSSKE